MQWPDLRVVLAVWEASADVLEKATAELTGADAVAGSLDELVARATALAAQVPMPDYQPAPVPEREIERLAALRRSGVLDEAMRGAFDRIAKRAADVFDSPMARVSFIDDDWQLIHGDAASCGRPDSGPPARGAARSLSLCGHVVCAEQTMVVPDIARDARFAANPALKERGVRFYAGAPLCGEDGFVLGTLCLLDTKPRTLSPCEVLLLESMAAEIMASIKARLAAQAGAGIEPPASGLAVAAP